MPCIILHKGNPMDEVVCDLSPLRVPDAFEQAALFCLAEAPDFRRPPAYVLTQQVPALCGELGLRDPELGQELHGLGGHDRAWLWPRLSRRLSLEEECRELRLVCGVDPPAEGVLRRRELTPLPRGDEGNANEACLCVCRILAMMQCVLA